MAQIQVLDSQTVNKIAAGEVIERPASIVKELVENAIDAGAHTVSVEIAEGGIERIRVTDDGCGIDAAEVRSAFLRHATSKIRTAEDLSLVTTLGFRGEALASIAAVACVDLVTKTAAALTGFHYVIEGGRESIAEEVAAVNGTKMTVEHLFFNMPARKKFLKRASAEGAAVHELMQKFVMGHPDVRFRFARDGKTILQSTGSGKPEDAIYAVYGKEVLGALLPVQSDVVSGFVSKPQLVRSNRSYEHFYLNGRQIRSAVLESTLGECYKDLVMPGSFPLAVLYLTLDPLLVDVNVHPTKTEVRFSDEERVREAVYDAVKTALSDKVLTPKVVSSFTYDQTANVRTGILTERPILYPNVPPAAAADLLSEVGNIEATAVPDAPDAPDVSDTSEAPKAPEAPVQEIIPELRQDRELMPAAVQWIGCAFATYWFFEADGRLYMMDQHAAHERVLYDRIKEKTEQTAFDSQLLLEPEVIHLSPSEMECFRTHKEELEALGFSCDDFEGDSLLVRAVPYVFCAPLSGNDLATMLALVQNASHDVIRDRFLLEMATLACKAAIKGGQMTTQTEIMALYEDLQHTTNPFNCPHGRPTVVSMTKEQLEKLFKRIL